MKARSSAKGGGSSVTKKSRFVRLFCLSRVSDYRLCLLFPPVRVPWMSGTIASTPTVFLRISAPFSVGSHVQPITPQPSYQMVDISVPSATVLFKMSRVAVF